MEVLVRDRMPCWYGLSWRKEDRAILISIHHDFLADFPVIKPDAPEVLSMMQEFGFSSFEGDFEHGFGFDQSLAIQAKSDEFTWVVAPLPLIHKETKRKCKYCRGSGKDKQRDSECFYCEGRGREDEYHWRNAFAISASLGLFFRLAYFPQKRTSSAAPQLLTVRLHTAQGMHGGELSGMYSIPLAEWLRSRPPHTGISEIVNAMKIAYGHMLGASRVDEYSRFRASVDYKNGWLNVDCPGNGCGLHPARSPESDRGYEFSSQNVDSPAQQLTLLAGLAAFCNRVQEDIA